MTRVDADVARQDRVDPPEQVVEFVAAIAAGELDQWSGRFLRVGVDDLDVLRGADARGRRPAAPAAALRGRRPARLSGDPRA